jgi:hypothetical protein
MSKIDFKILLLILLSLIVIISCVRQDDPRNLRSDSDSNREDDNSSEDNNEYESDSESYAPSPGTNTTYMLVSPPSGVAGDKFSKKCKNPVIDGFLLTAKCQNNSNNTVNASVNFSNCIKNYDGNLRIFDGRDKELYTEDCDINNAETKIVCKCQQPSGGNKTCSIKLNDVFKVVNGELKC